MTHTTTTPNDLLELTVDCRLGLLPQTSTTINGSSTRCLAA